MGIEFTYFIKVRSEWFVNLLILEYTEKGLMSRTTTQSRFFFVLTFWFRSWLKMISSTSFHHKDSLARDQNDDT